MSNPEPEKDELKNYLDGDSQISKLYENAKVTAPPAHIDGIVLSRAQNVVDRQKTKFSWFNTWSIPISTAAVAILAVGLISLIPEQEKTAPPFLENPSPEVLSLDKTKSADLQESIDKEEAHTIEESSAGLSTTVGELENDESGGALDSKVTDEKQEERKRTLLMKSTPSINESKSELRTDPASSEKKSLQPQESIISKSDKLGNNKIQIQLSSPTEIINPNRLKYSPKIESQTRKNQTEPYKENSIKMHGFNIQKQRSKKPPAPVSDIQSINEPLELVPKPVDKPAQPRTALTVPRITPPPKSSRAIGQDKTRLVVLSESEYNLLIQKPFSEAAWKNLHPKHWIEYIRLLTEKNKSEQAQKVIDSFKTNFPKLELKDQF